MKKLNLISALLLITLFLHAQTSQLPDIQLVEFASGFNQPLGIEHAGDSRLFVVEQTGKIRIVDANGQWKSHFLNIQDKVLSTGFEQGLLGLAFDPGYAVNGYFYVHYTNLDGDSHISRFRVNPHHPDKAMPNSEVILLVVDQPFTNHNSGQLKFGPDGYLYITFGDGGAGGDPFNNAQNPGTLLGKIIRIDPMDNGTYAVPPTNPFVGMPGFREEIWASGLRNPWRFSFDYLTGDLWIADVGQNIWEEINYQSASSPGGENYGWSCMEGNHFFKMNCGDNGIPFTAPVAEYEHSEDPMFPCSGSVTGGYVYRGATYPDMYGKYFYTDFCTGVLRTTYWDGADWISAELGNFTPFAYSTFGEDIHGELYLTDKTSGTIYRLTDGDGGAYAQVPNEILTAEWKPSYTIAEMSADQTEIDWDERIIESILRPNSTIGQLSGREMEYHILPNPNHGPFTVYFTAPQTEAYSSRILDMMGREVHVDKREIMDGPNEWRFNSSELSDGLYYLQIRTGTESTTLKFVVN